MKVNRNISNFKIGDLVNVKVKTINDYNVNFSDKFILMLVLDGSFIIEANRQYYELKKDELFFINENQLYTTKTNDLNNLVLLLEVDPLFFVAGLHNFENIDFSGFIEMNSEKNKIIARNIKSIIADIVFRINEKAAGFEFKVINNLYSIAELLVSNLKDSSFVVDKINDEINDKRLQRILGYINKDYKTKLTLKSIAKKEDLSYYYLSHFIKSTLGITFQEYLNKVRLDEALRLLMTTRKSITDVYIHSGFPSMAALNSVFRDEFDTTPGVYRRKYYHRLLEEEQRNKELNLNDPKVEKLLKVYMNENLSKKAPSYGKLEKKLISIDNFDDGIPFVKHWQQFINIDSILNILNEQWQKQFLMLKNDIPFKKVRFKGILSAIASVYNYADNSEEEYNWTQLNNIFDFLQENDISPIIYLTSKTGENPNVEGPTYDNNFKTKIIIDFLNHFINRYGLEKIEMWSFEIFDEPSEKFYHNMIIESNSFVYFNITSKAIKSISPRIKIGGPSSSNSSLLSKEWFKVFSNFVKENRAPIDYLSMKLSSDYYPIDSLEKLNKIAKDKDDFSRMLPLLNKNYHKPKYLQTTLQRVQNHLTEVNRKGFEVSISQWSFSSIAGDLNNDTMGVGPIIVKNMIESIGLANSIGYINFSDLFERYNTDDTHFYGGVGLINKDGIKKPSYNAFYLLSKLGDNVISIGDSYIVTKSTDSIQILAFNYAQFDELYSVGERSHISQNDRYSIFEEKSSLKIEVLIDNLKGNYEISSFELNRENGSTFDEWVSLGAPAKLNDFEIQHLKTKDHPKLIIEQANIENRYSIELDLPLHGIQLTIIKEIM